MFSVEDVDLCSLAMLLERSFGAELDEGYLDGRTTLRDAVASALGCSSLEAEELVDTLEARGYVRFPRLPDDTHSRRAQRWTIHPSPR